MNNQQWYLYSLTSGVTLGIIGVIFLFSLYANAIITVVITIPGASLALTTIIIRICISFTMAFFLLRQWFLQENQFLTDIPFLFGMFFLLHAFGKFVDIVNFFTYYEIPEGELLMIMKLRQFIAVATLAPMMYLSLTMIVLFLAIKYEDTKYADQRTRDKLAIKLFIAIIFIEFTIILLSPNMEVSIIIFPLLVIPSIIIIVWIMFFSYRQQRLSQIHPLIVGIGFSLYLFASAFRPVAITIFGDTPTYIIFAEFLELGIFCVIFIGLLLKADYRNI